MTNKFIKKDIVKIKNKGEEKYRIIKVINLDYIGDSLIFYSLENLLDDTLEPLTVAETDLEYDKKYFFRSVINRNFNKNV